MFIIELVVIVEKSSLFSPCSSLLVDLDIMDRSGWSKRKRNHHRPLPLTPNTNTSSNQQMDREMELEMEVVIDRVDPRRIPL